MTHVNSLVRLCVVLAAFGVCAFFAGGCGVMTVDVDVYKGPLANHRDVQVQQAVGLAAAAKPLLGKLRYELEHSAAGWCKKKDGCGGNVKLKDLKHSDDYTSDRKLQPDGQKDPRYYKYCSREAEFVNRLLLASYNDQEENKRLAQERTAAITEYEKQLKTPGSGKSLGRILEQRMYQEDRKTVGPDGVQPNSNDGGKRLSPLGARPEGRPGRLGLESLLESYEAALRRRREEGVDETEDFPELMELSDALLSFAQRMTFVVNHEALFGQETPGVPQMAWKAGRFVLVGTTREASTQHAYVRVLQAVGNSIIVSLNELREEKQHRDRSEAAGPREVAAQQAVLNAEPRKVLAGIVESLRLKEAEIGQKLIVPAGQPTPTEALEQAEAAVTDAEEAETEAGDAVVPLQQAADDALTANRPALDALGVVANTALDDDKKPLLPAAAGIRASAAETSVKGLVAQFVEAIEKDIAGNGSSPERHQRLGKVLDALPAADGLDDTEGPRADRLVELEGLLTPKAAQARLAIDAANTALVEAKDKASRAKEELDDALERRTAAEQAVKAEENLKAQQATLNAAITAVLDAVTDVLNRDDVSKPPAPPAVVHDRLVRVLTEKAAGLDDAEERKKLAAAIEVVAAQTPPPPLLNVPATEDGTPTNRDVLDNLIATLRVEHVAAVRKSGKDSRDAQRFEDALAAAYAQRSGMIYIRPASAYLRTSFPATSLQRDAPIGWQNMLARHYTRQLPLVGEGLNNGPELRTLLDLDKQYWQNVNTVRVAGGGNTNYVLAKDDIGNWYVKNYSADPKDIIKSGQSLALFALGPALQAPGLLAAFAAEQESAAKIASGDLNADQVKKELENVQKAQETANQATGGTAAAGTGTGTGTGGGAGTGASAAAAASPPVGSVGSVLSRQLADETKKFNASGEKHLVEAKDNATKLEDGLKGAWGEDADFKAYEQRQELIDPILKKSAAALVDDVTRLTTPPGDAAAPATDRVIDVLKAMLSFRQKLAAALDAHSDAKDKAAKEAEKKFTDEKPGLEAKVTEAKTAEADAEKEVAAREADLKNAPADWTPEQRKPLETKVEQAKATLAAKTEARKAAEKALKDAEDAAKAVRDEATKAEKAVEAAKKITTRTVRQKVLATLDLRDRSSKEFEIAIGVIEGTLAGGK